MTLHLLDNVVWNCLAGPHVRFSTGTSSARRYAPGFTPIIGFADAKRPDFAALEQYCEPGEHFYCADWSGPAPAGWQIITDAIGHQMVWAAAVPAADEKLAALRLGPEHVPQVLDLIAISPPGPFGPRTIELGEYFGVFEGTRLAAVAGERMEAGAFTEISGVSTHPDFQGRGYARRLILKLVRRQMQRKRQPFLHVMDDNLHARGLYARMGFRHHQQMVLRVVAREQ